MKSLREQIEEMRQRMAEKCEQCGRTVRETLPIMKSHYDHALAREYVDKVSWVCPNCFKSNSSTH